MSDNILSLKNVTMKFGGVVALNDVSFDIKKQEILGLIGPNGAGKTTVFNVITGVYQVTEGDITFEGASVKGKKRYKITRGGIARTFQNIRLWGDMTALENVITATDTHKKSGLVSGLFGLPVSRREEKRGKARAQELLDFIGIGEYADRLAKNLPYGVQRRLEIARALGTEPKLLLLDEPAAGFNPAEKVELANTIRKIRDAGYTVLLIEHDMSLVMGVSDRVVVIDFGQKIADDLPADSYWRVEGQTVGALAAAIRTAYEQIIDGQAKQIDLRGLMYQSQLYQRSIEVYERAIASHNSK